MEDENEVGTAKKMRAMIKLKDMERRVASFVLGKTGRIVEYSFALQHTDDAKNILEVGCSGSSFAFNLARKGCCVHAIDFRKYPFRQKRLNFYFADVRYLPFADDSFDVITCISTIEHIGTGEYGDPIDKCGDLHAMMEMSRVCKTGGRVVITTSWAEKYRDMPGLERYYDDARLNKLVKGLKLEVEEYYAPLRRVWNYTFNWNKVSKEITKRAFSLGSRPIVCLVLKKI